MRDLTTFKGCIFTLFVVSLALVLLGCGGQKQGPTKEEITEYGNFLDSVLERVSAQALTTIEEVGEIETKQDVERLSKTFTSHKETSRERFSNIAAKTPPAGFEEIHEEVLLLCAAYYYGNYWVKSGLDSLEQSPEGAFKFIDASVIAFGVAKVKSLRMAKKLAEKLEKKLKEYTE